MTSIGIGRVLPRSVGIETLLTKDDDRFGISIPWLRNQAMNLSDDEIHARILKALADPESKTDDET